MNPIYERELQLPCSIVNEFRPKNDDVLYRGEIFALGFDTPDLINGYARLAKYQLRMSLPGTVALLFARLLKRSPPHPTLAWVPLWSIDTSPPYGPHAVWLRNAILHRGQPRPAAECASGFRSNLVAKAATDRIIITDDLLDAVFGDIECKLRPYADIVATARHAKR